MNDINQRMRCIVLEDEDSSRHILIEKLKSFEELDLIGEAVSVNESFKLICTQKPDVAFMDVKLIGGDIFQLLDRLKSIGAHIPFIIVITGFEEFALQALNEYHSHIVQYLIKPFSDNWEIKFRKAIDALMLAISRNSTNVNHLDFITDDNVFAESSPHEFTFITNKKNYQRVNFDDVVYLEAAGSGATYIVTDSDTIRIDNTINKCLEEMFPIYFIRISKSNAVNKNKILQINRDDRTLMVRLGDKDRVLGVGDVYYGDLVNILVK